MLRQCNVLNVVEVRSTDTEQDTNVGRTAGLRGKRVQTR